MTIYIYIYIYIKYNSYNEYKCRHNKLYTCTGESHNDSPKTIQ